MSDKKTHVHNQQFLRMVQDSSISPGDRASAMIFHICETGLDAHTVVGQVIAEADQGRQLSEKLEAQQSHPLAGERFIGTIEQPHLYAAVTRGPGVVYLRAQPDEIAGLQQGDPVLIDLKEDRIVGRNGHIGATGDVVTVECLPPDCPNQIVVKHHEHSQLAWLHHNLLDQPNPCQPGSRMLYDPQRRFVLAPVETRTDGSELLADPAKLGEVRREDVGAPKPVVGEIVDKVRQFVEYPDWAAKMRVRQRVSYLFVGGTGTGKSHTLKFIAHEVHDFCEQLTGVRISRVIVCDASQFWNSLFGATEQRIAAWAETLQALGSQVLSDKNGQPLRFPLIIVLEECEALLRIRGDQTGSGHLFDRPLALLLQKTESIENAIHSQIIWIATTNRPDLADPAALRRLGMRRVFFGNLTLDEAASVLATKIPEDMPIRDADGDPQSAREAVFRQVLGYLYGPTPKQDLVEVRMVNSDRRILKRRDLVTPATLEEAVSAAVDDCLRQSRREGRLLGLDGNDVVRFLHRHYTGLSRSLTRYNLPAYCPEWFEDDMHEIASVTPLARRDRRAIAPIH
jgi:ATP-dependent 26S proteasome regulatory subunit